MSKTKMISSNEADEYDYSNDWFDCHEKKILLKVINKGKVDEARQSLLCRKVWIDGMGTRLHKYKLFEWFEKVTGEVLI